jgi:hypothetical protein
MTSRAPYRAQLPTSSRVASGELAQQMSPFEFNLWGGD